MQKEITPIFKGLIKDGKILISDPMSYNSWLLRLNGKKVSLSIKRWQDKRTGQQNKFYWKYLNIISDELTGGETSAEWYHEYFKRIHLSVEEITLTLKDSQIKKIIIPGSSTELSKYQFSRYLMLIEQDSGVPIPNPKLFGYDKDIYSRTPVKENA